MTCKKKAVIKAYRTGKKAVTEACMTHKKAAIEAYRTGKKAVIEACMTHTKKL